MTKETLNITGMDCASCAQNISRVLKKADGIISAEVNFAANKAYVEYDETKINLEKITKLVEKSGYGVAGKNNSTAPADMEKAMEKNSMSMPQAHQHADIKASRGEFIKVILAIILTIPFY